jgi:hypothetical protein
MLSIISHSFSSWSGSLCLPNNPAGAWSVRSRSERATCPAAGWNAGPGNQRKAGSAEPPPHRTARCRKSPASWPAPALQPPRHSAARRARRREGTRTEPRTHHLRSPRRRRRPRLPAAPGSAQAPTPSSNLTAAARRREARRHRPRGSNALNNGPPAAPCATARGYGCRRPGARGARTDRARGPPRVRRCTATPPARGPRAAPRPPPAPRGRARPLCAPRSALATR